MMRLLTLPIFTAFWMAQAISAHSQDMQPRIDELAAGMDDFAPSVEELPLDEISDDFGDSDSVVETQQTTAEPAVQPEPAAPVATVANIPEGWDKHSFLGLTFAVPTDWMRMSDPDDKRELAFGDIDMKEKRFLGINVMNFDSGEIGDFEKDTKDLPKEMAKEFGVDLTGAKQAFSYPDPIIAADGGRLLRKKFVLRKDDFFIYTELLYKEGVDEHGDTDAIGVVSMNKPEAEVAPLIEQIIGTISLDAAPVVEPEAQVGVDGLVNYSMPLPKGWSRQFDGSDAINFITTPTFSAATGVDTGYRARTSWEADSEFDGAPEISRGEIFGQPATIKKGMLKEAYFQVGYKGVAGLQTLYKLDKCLADGDSIVIHEAAAPEWLVSTGFDSLQETISLTLPDDAIPCDAETEAAPAADATIASGWTTYTNGRFGTSARYPTSHFQQAGEPPENGDGRSFVSTDGQAELLVWGSHNALEQTPQQMVDDIRTSHAAATIIAQEVRVNGFAIKLQDGGIVLQQNSILDAEGVVHSALVRYPVAQEATYGAAAQAVADSLSALKGSAGDATPLATADIASAPKGSLPVSPPASEPDRVWFDKTGIGQWKGEFVTLSNPGTGSQSGAGELEALALGDGENGYFLAPDQVLGDWRGSKGLQVVLRIKSGNGSYYDPYIDGGRGDLFLQSNGMSASIEFDRPVGADWTTQTVSFDDPRWRVSGAPSMHSLLGNVTRFDVRAEYLNGDTRAAMASIDWMPVKTELLPSERDGTARPLTATPPAATGMEKAFWDSVQGSAQVESFEAYLQQFPNGVYAAAARQRIEELMAPALSTDPQVELTFWQSIQSSSDPAMFQAYLDQWPNGTFALLARLNLKRLTAVVVTPSPQPAPQPAPLVRPAPSARGYYTPARKTAERNAIMDAARVPMLRELGQKVIFLVKTLRTDGDWCFLMAEPLQPNGRKLNWYTTPYANDWANDAMSDLVMVLMRWQGNGWQVVDYVIGPTDVHWYSWIDRYGLPERLFTSG
jgi:hypothetical protein